MQQSNLQQLIALYKFWGTDPFPTLTATMTDDQKRAYLDPKNCILIEGGNQSGKSRTTILKVVAFALEEIEGCFAGQDVNIWYSTTTYDSFAGPAWAHFKNALLFPGESTSKLPTTRIQAIDWLGKAPEKPRYFSVKRPSGATAHIHVKSYAQGRSEFQGQTIHCVVIDEECPEEIYTEIMARTFASKGARVFVCCTPVEGEDWLDILRKDAEDGVNTSKYRLSTLDNPMVNREVIDNIKKMYGNIDDEVQLRLLGIPRLSSGLVFGDKVFTPDHIIDTVKTNISHWTLNRAIDAGYRNPGCVWMAVSPDEKQILIYRTWKGRDCTIAQAAEEITRLSGAERYHWDIIDPAVCQTNAETGQPEWAVWQKNGVRAVPAPDNRVHSGIERMWGLLNERVEIPDIDGRGTVMRPRLRVCRETCTDWLEERRKYRFKDVVKDPQRDDVDFKVVKKNDHLMDPTRYLIAAGLRFVPEGHRPPPEGSSERYWWDMRHKDDKKRKR